jgi:hypothetical protein
LVDILLTKRTVYGKISIVLIWIGAMNMKKIGKWILSVCALGAIFSIAGCTDKKATSSIGGTSQESSSMTSGGYNSVFNPVDPLPMPVAPVIPELFVKDGVLYWEIIDGESYEVKIGNGDWELVFEYEVDLREISDLTIVQVRALRDGMVSDPALHMVEPS